MLSSMVRTMISRSSFDDAMVYPFMQIENNPQSTAFYTRNPQSAQELISLVLTPPPERPKPLVPLAVEFDRVDRADAVLLGQVRKALSVEPADPAVGPDPDQSFGIDLDGMDHVSGEAVLLGIALPGFPIERREAAAEGPDPEMVSRVHGRRADIVGVLLQQVRARRMV